MNEYPEIPPNCQYFKTYQRKKTFEIRATTFVYLHNADIWRPIIACVAAEYWHKEIKDRANGPKKADLVARGIGLPEREAIQDNYDEECERHADEWRKWGGLASAGAAEEDSK